MPKLILRGAFIRFVDLRYDEKSKTVYTKVNFTSAFTEPVREAMEWGEPPAGFASAKLDGDFTATHLILTPNGRELKQHEIQIGAKEIGGFELHRVKDDDGGSTHNELRFQVLSTDPEAAAKLREYLGVIGKGEAQMRINYEAQSEMDLEGEESQEQLISEEQAEDTSEEKDGGAMLAPRPIDYAKGRRNRARSADPIN